MEQQLTPTNMDAQTERLLAALDPRVAAKVREHFAKDYDEFSKAAQAAQGSTEPSHWAKPSCNRCHGQGYSGTIVAHKFHDLVGKKELCTCSVRRYFRWLQKFRTEFNAKKESSHV